MLTVNSSASGFLIKENIMEEIQSCENQCCIHLDSCEDFCEKYCKKLGYDNDDGYIPCKECIEDNERKTNDTI